MVGQLFKIVFSRKAQQRIREISDYYTENASADVAKNVRRKIAKEAQTLAHLPASKPRLPEAEHLDAEIRYTKAWSFKIIFQILHPMNIVRILTIRHDNENPAEIKKEL